MNTCRPHAGQDRASTRRESEIMRSRAGSTAKPPLRLPLMMITCTRPGFMPRLLVHASDSPALLSWFEANHARRSRLFRVVRQRSSISGRSIWAHRGPVCQPSAATLTPRPARSVATSSWPPACTRSAKASTAASSVRSHARPVTRRPCRLPFSGGVARGTPAAGPVRCRNAVCIRRA